MHDTQVELLLIAISSVPSLPKLKANSQSGTKPFNLQIVLNVPYLTACVIYRQL